MRNPTTGVYPVFDNIFKVSTTGKGDTATMATIADLETFSVSFDNNVEEWTPMDTKGWIRRMQTGKGFTISLSGKRNIGDAGNDYVAGLAWKTGSATSTTFEWDFPDGTVVKFDCVIDVKNVGGGDSTNVAALEFDVMSDGAPTITEAAA